MSGRVSQRRLPLAGEVYPGTPEAPPLGRRLRVFVGGVPVVALVSDAWPWTLLSLTRHRQVDMVPSLHQVAGGAAIAADAWVALETATVPSGLRVRLYLVDALPADPAAMAEMKDGPADMLLNRDLAACLGWASC
ncbi:MULTISPECIES: hypothetical protein [Nitrospirillum]|uniref:Uncharacterized protein n=1 Tax=Nitrospirillum amazonense TaxID=28077 RepID=A0A560G1E8_9PROT|nr:hypothetical protein [Nitrospirillum amazonense]MEC4589476.1 hypothetical protein [Nitrospirillum amazonense]TWB27718.1 hypothetical protein FBZ88_106181 [Nitrospirillum amazonense]